MDPVRQLLNKLFTEYSPYLVVAVVAVLVLMRIGLALTTWDTPSGRFILWFWHPDARRREAPLEALYPLTLQNMDGTLLALGVVFLLIRPFVLQAFFIPSASMEPTLFGRSAGHEFDDPRNLRMDRVLVNKYVFWLRQPRRGEILVFRAPPAAHPLDPKPQDYIKRLIGLPGDMLEVKNHRVWINGQKLDERYLPDLANARPSPLADYGPFRVPPDHYFMMGDNRSNSSDSRAWGPLPRANVLGKAMCVFWPLFAYTPDHLDTGRQLAVHLLR